MKHANRTISSFKTLIGDICKESIVKHVENSEDITDDIKDILKDNAVFLTEYYMTDEHSKEQELQYNTIMAILHCNATIESIRLQNDIKDAVKLILKGASILL